jgi:hypothetical protein
LGVDIDRAGRTVDIGCEGNKGWRVAGNMAVDDIYILLKRQVNLTVSYLSHDTAGQKAR